MRFVQATIPLIVRRTVDGADLADAFRYEVEMSSPLINEMSSMTPNEFFGHRLRQPVQTHVASTLDRENCTFDLLEVLLFLVDGTEIPVKMEGKVLTPWLSLADVRYIVFLVNVRTGIRSREETIEEAGTSRPAPANRAPRYRPPDAEICAKLGVVLDAGNAQQRGDAPHLAEGGCKSIYSGTRQGQRVVVTVEKVGPVAEREVASRMQMGEHPNIMSILSYCEHQNTVYMVCPKAEYAAAIVSQTTHPNLCLTTRVCARFAAKTSSKRSGREGTTRTGGSGAWKRRTRGRSSARWWRGCATCTAAACATAT